VSKKFLSVQSISTIDKICCTFVFKQTWICFFFFFKGYYWILFLLPKIQMAGWVKDLEQNSVLCIPGMLYCVAFGLFFFFFQVILEIIFFFSKINI